ncbi:DUF3237 family protein [Streptomyces sp. AA1529]|uniref:DUF3237 family protein n=1 Tax=Streptomyces sp. AA1529 TaxID=1203257 RepID=UPI00131A114E|nr:DUF3237 family protein [Streptomyces sp. AA1529]
MTAGAPRRRRKVPRARRGCPVRARLPHRTPLRPRRRGDRALFGPDRTTTLDVRPALRTRDGALLRMSCGRRLVTPSAVRDALGDPAARHRADPAGHYFRTDPLFGTGAERYARLDGTVGIGSGRCIEGGVRHRVCEVL